MIKLTLHQQSEAKTFLFSKETISIGEGENVDIPLKGLGLHKNHIKITLVNNQYYIFNQANDPFITLNGAPFGKKKLKVHDTLQLKYSAITVDDVSFDSIPLEDSPQTEGVNLEEQICDYPNAEKLAKEDDLEGWFPSDLSELQIEGITKAEDQKQEEPNQEPISQQKKSFFSLNSLKWFMVCICTLFIVASAIGFEIYFRAASKSDFEENKAAESLADLAMALTYAKVFHVIPQNNNYSEPEFLKSNLVNLLPVNSSASGTIDTQGHFSNCSYLFRFYSEQGLSRFLIIAQPAPSLSQWLFPKDSILIDSSLMDLRKISDLKEINSLLAASKPFDGANGKELTEIIKNLKVLSLTHLAKVLKKKEFTPPKILKYLRPGSENFIYNAPRYYLFTEPLIKKILLFDLENQGQEGKEILQNEVERFAIFENLILYTSEGLQATDSVNKALHDINKASNFLTGYILLSPEAEILSSRLNIDVKESIRRTPNIDIDSNEIAQVDSATIPLSRSQMIEAKLRKFKQTAIEILHPIIKELSESLKESLANSEPEIKNEFFLLLNTYQKAKQELEKKLENLIRQFEKQYQDITPIFRYLKEQKLDNYISFSTKNRLSLDFITQFPYLPYEKKGQKTTPPFLLVEFKDPLNPGN